MFLLLQAFVIWKCDHGRMMMMVCFCLFLPFIWSPSCFLTQWWQSDTIFLRMSCRLAASCYPECPRWDVDPDVFSSDTLRLLNVWINHTVCWSVSVWLFHIQFTALGPGQTERRFCSHLFSMSRKCSVCCWSWPKLGKKKRKSYLCCFFLLSSWQTFQWWWR